MKIILTFLITFTVIAGLNAQSNLGVRAGVNFATHSGGESFSDNVDFSSVTGCHIGINYELATGGLFAIRPGVIYSIKGTTSTSLLGGNSEASDLKLYYLEVPVDFVLDLAFIDVFFGPYFSYGLGGSLTVNDVDVDFDYDDDDFKRTDYGVTLGANFDINNDIFIGAQYQLGLGNVSDIDEEGFSVTNRTFSGFLSYRF